MNENDLHDYWTAQIDGSRNVASPMSMLGGQTYDNWQGRQPYTGPTFFDGSAKSVGASGETIFDAAREFGEEWTEFVCELLEDWFAWVPGWVGLVFKFTGVFVMLVLAVQLDLTGGLSLLGFAIAGWFVPKAIKWTAIISLHLTLSVLFMAFFAVAVMAIGATILGLLWLFVYLIR
ncbi:hypothetical protein C5Y96_20430 [Blastopirellula marina]|uniref:Uncharacterized protein n=1 Tax=Blastopirellula marina TaxID=124 RepID=A0A2S8F2L1_9BACT|nr:MULTISPECIES: hypothetical protein [Pirellulaceae]PQO26401.1 hypothetical protein C5Y96_20430 [Blastopirellula marina]RCS44857.1 hypothetical protein DTL36_20460 [Bremerella cremea]